MRKCLRADGRLQAEVRMTAAGVPKLIYLAKRNPNIPETGFSEAWISHTRLASTMKNTIGPYFARVRQCIKGYGVDVPPEYVNSFDGAGVMTMRTWEGLHAVRAHKDMVTVMKEDELRVFSDYGENFTVIAAETCHFEKREGFAALIHFIARRADVTPEQFDQYLRTQYVEKVTGLPLSEADACVFATNKVSYVPGPAYDFAAVSELWFDDVAHAQAAAHDAGHRAVMRDLNAAVADSSRTVGLLTRLNIQKKIGDGLPS
jgi:hypothetical protein